jgi:hypothetical protein
LCTLLSSQGSGAPAELPSGSRSGQLFNLTTSFCGVKFASA